MISSLNETLKRQMKEKNQQKNNLSQSKVAERSTMLKQENEYKHVLDNSAYLKKIQALNYKQSLDQQIANKRDNEFMTDNEKRINAEFFRPNGQN